MLYCSYMILLLPLLLLLLQLSSISTESFSSSSNNNNNNNNEHYDEVVDFPPLLDSEDIAYFSSTHDIDGLHWALSNVFDRSKRNTDSSKIKYHDLPQVLVSRGGGDTYTTQYKLEMDLEQARYLVNNKNILSRQQQIYFQEKVIPAYEAVLRNIPSLDRLKKTEGLYPFSKSDYEAGIGEVYNKALHVTDFDALKDKKGELMPLLNQKFDSKKIEDEWYNNSQHYGVGIVVIDNILSPLALDRIRKLLYESTVFYQTKMPLKFGGYVGAYIDDGLYDKILLQLAFELNKALPNIMAGHPLKYLWAYKYDSRYTGINTHADQAAVNVNIWLTPEDANLNKQSGGLIVFTAKPPKDWDFQRYNTDTDDKVMKELLEPTNFANVTVPYRENRAVIFDSALFHHTDSFQFKEGYENRRINLTILYGSMKMADNDDASSSDNVRDEL